VLLVVGVDGLGEFLRLLVCLLENSALGRLDERACGTVETRRVGTFV
jgi:hypothetical protein